MNLTYTTKLVAGHAAGAGAASTVFLGGVSLAPGAIPLSLGILGVLGPLAVATVSVLLHHHNHALVTATAQRGAGVQCGRVGAPARTEVTAR
ncbi:hypothetical protein [Micromonospora sp. NPDC004704]